MVNKECSFLLLTIKSFNMKNNTISAFIIALLVAFALTGCMETRYYRQNNRHSHGYYQRRHMTPPPGLQIDIRR